MATVGALSVDFSTNSAAFVRDMGKSARAVNSNSARMNKSLARLDRGFLKVRKNMASMAKRAFSLRGAVATLVGGAGLGLLIKRSLDSADSIAKTADAIGISTDALQEYRFALDISGVAMDKTDKGLKKFVRNMGELERSSSETQTALKDLDPTLLQNLRSLNSVEDQLALTFRALAGYTSQSKRAAVGQALLGRAAVDMTVAIKNGIAPFEALRQQARDLGIVIEEKLLRNAENAKDQLNILSRVIGTNVTEAILKAAPQIKDLAERFAAAIPEILNTTQAFLEFIGVLEKSRIQKIKEDIATLTVRIKSLNQELETPLGQRTEGPGADLLERMIDERDVLQARVRVLENPVKPAAPGVPAPSPGPATGIAGLIPGRKDFEAADKAAGRFEAERAQAEFIIQKLREQTAARNELAAVNEAAAELARERALVVVRAGATAVEAYNREIQELRDLREALAETGQSALLSEEQFQRAAAQSLERLQERQKAEQEARRTTDEMTEAQRRLVEGGFNLLDRAIAGNMESWRDWARFAINQIQRVLSALAQGQGFGGSFLGSFLTFFSGSGSGGGGDFFEFAHGGRPPVGRPSIVGERGPEIFIPDRPGTIIPSNFNAPASVVIHQRFDFRGASLEAVALLRQESARIKRETIAEIERRRVRGMSVARRG